MPEDSVNIEQLTEQRRQIASVYLHPLVAKRLRCRSTCRIFIPVIKQPKIKQTVKSGQISIHKYIKSDDGLSDQVHFAYGQKPIKPPSNLICSQNTSLVLRENFRMFYAEDFGCQTDGSCGKTCLDDYGQPCCVVYSDDYFDTGQIIKQEYMDDADYIVRLFHQLPNRTSRHMPKELGRTLLVPISYKVKAILSIREEEAQEAGYESCHELFRLWEEAYGRNASFRIAQRPWVQAINVNIINDESHSFDIHGYKQMIKNKLEDKNV